MACNAAASNVEGKRCAPSAAKDGASLGLDVGFADNLLIAFVLLAQVCAERCSAHRVRKQSKIDQLGADLGLFQGGGLPGGELFDRLLRRPGRRDPAEPAFLVVVPIAGL